MCCVLLQGGEGGGGGRYIKDSVFLHSFFRFYSYYSDKIVDKKVKYAS